MKERLVPIVLKGEAPFTERIYDNFCTNCKYKKNIVNIHTYPCFVSCDGVCVRFEFSSDKLREKYEQEVLENQATTIWIERGKSLEEIYKMSKEELLSVLTKKHYAQFEKRRQEDKKDLEMMLKRAKQVVVEEDLPPVKRGRKKKEEKEEKEDLVLDEVKGKTHYFYCEDKEGKKSTIKRSVDSPSYRVGVRSLRKSLLKQGIKIISEEVK